MSTIRALPPEVAAQLKSSVNITSLSEAVLGLVKNALDSGPTRIDIEVDFGRSSCTVEDDGIGIDPSEFDDSGGLCRPFHTSKHQGPEATHGCHGTFLASLGTISILNIISRKKGAKSRCQMSVYQGQRIIDRTGRRTGIDFRNRKHGTKVTASDLFGNMPVRVKQRPLGDDMKAHRDKAWRLLCNDVIGILLAWKERVALSMQASDKDHVFNIKHDSPASQPPSLGSGATLDLVKACIIMTNVTGGQSPQWSSWVQTVARGESWSVSGLISKYGHASRSVQFISLGLYSLPKGGSWDCLYEAVNKVFTLSTFGQKPDSTTHRGRGDDKATNNELGDSANRHPMYYLRIDDESTPASSIRPDCLKSRDLTRLISMIEAMAVGFLKKQGHHASRRTRQPSRSMTLSPLVTQHPSRLAFAPENGFGNLPLQSRMKSGGIARVVKPVLHDTPTVHPDTGTEDTFSTFDETEVLAMCRDIEPIVTESGDHLVTWLDPKSGRRARINTRTGMVEDPSGSASGDGVSGWSLISERRLTLDQKRQGTTLASDTLTWTDGLAENWNDTVFCQREKPIPGIPTEDKDLEKLANLQQFGQAHQSLREGASKTHDAVESRITVGDLRHAHVVNQVDNKFILAQVEKELDGRAAKVVLFIIDQHAADERVRVEALYRELCLPVPPEQASAEDKLGCPISTLRLEKPVVFNASLDEVELLRQSEEYFARWGILYLLQSSGVRRERTWSRTKRTCPVTILTVPPIIAERCRREPNHLRDMLLEEVWSRDEPVLRGARTNQRDVSADAALSGCDDQNQHWLHRIHDCPKGLLNMVHSRSCRSALMFNDELSLEQCQDLVTKLSRCVFPFQCAHGRPSLLPLTHTDVFHEPHSVKHGLADFSEAYQKWTESESLG